MTDLPFWKSFPTRTPDGRNLADGLLGHSAACLGIFPSVRVAYKGRLVFGRIFSDMPPIRTTENTSPARSFIELSSSDDTDDRRRNRLRLRRQTATRGRQRMAPFAPLRPSAPGVRQVGFLCLVIGV
jgi:hypothetical protein